MASCLWVCPFLLCIIFTSVATEEINENVTCTFTNGKDCLYLLNLNNTTEYTIEKEDINRTGVKIIFDTEQGVESLHIKSGKEIANRVRVLNITRGSLNHLVTLPCLKEMQMNKITLEPVIVSKEIQIDFVEGCGNDTDPITITNIYYAVETDKDEISQDASQVIPTKEETQTNGASIPTGFSGTDLFTDLLTTPTVQQVESKELDDSTVKTASHLLTEVMTPIPTSLSTKWRVVATGKLMGVTKKDSLVEKADGEKEPNFKVGASKSSAQKATRDIACLFLALVIFKNA